MYAENKKILDKIRSKDEVMFRMAISHLMDVGVRHLTEENIQSTCKGIAKRDDSKAFMTNDYMCDLVIMAGEVAKVPHIDLLVYIQREIEYDVSDGVMSYKRAVELLEGCMSNINQWNDWDNSLTLHEFEDIGFDDDEIGALGFGCVLGAREEEDV
jgi:hypothetical protein